MTIRFLISLLLLHAQLYAEDTASLKLPDSAITLRAPTDWAIRKMYGDLSLFPPDNPEQGSPSRIHIIRTREAADSLQEAIEAELDSITKRSPGSGNSREHYKGSVAVKTASGIQGLRADFYFEVTRDGITTKRYQVLKYYFLDEKGKVFKICAHIYGDEAKFKRYESLILDNLLTNKVHK